MNLSELEERRQQLFSAYFQLTERIARRLNQPIKNIIGKDFARVLLPEGLKDKDQPREYCVETPHGNLTLDANRLTATSPFLAKDTFAKLTKTEAVILETLMQKRTQVYSENQLADEIKKMYEPGTFSGTPEMKFHITNLRRKLGIQSKPGILDYPIIKNVRGVGYTLL